jgi:hypothetical protein
VGDTKQVGGDHYSKMAVQPWDVMRSCFTPAAFAGFLTGNVVKYVMRANAKGGIEDLKKAQHYLDELIRYLEEPNNER